MKENYWWIGFQCNSMIATTFEVSGKSGKQTSRNPLREQSRRVFPFCASNFAYSFAFSEGRTSILFRNGSLPDCLMASTISTFTLEFVKVVNERYNCAICGKILQDPVQSSCGHRSVVFPFNTRCIENFKTFTDTIYWEINYQWISSPSLLQLLPLMVCITA